MALGVRPLAPGEPFIEITPRRDDYLREKARLLEEDDGYYVQQLPGAESALAEVARFVGFPSGDFDEAGRQVEADLLVLDPALAGVRLIGGHLCFANDWCLNDKLGRSLIDVHDVVPGFASALGTQSERLLAYLKPERPVVRLNWSVKPTDKLDLNPRWNEWIAERKREVTPENAGERCYLRIERQTLARMLETGAVLFAVQTLLVRLDEVAADPERARVLLGVLRTVPGPMLDYKGLTPFVDPVCQYLARTYS
jgi:hypothetical protein